MDIAFSKNIGISAIATYEPTWSLGNAWFEGFLPRKFEQHTGTQTRPVSWHDEVTMGLRAVANLRRDTRCDLRDCAAIIFASPSFVPMRVARKYLDPEQSRRERLMRAAHDLRVQLHLPRCPVFALNWFCSGYARALAVARRHIVPMLGLTRNAFVLVVTASRISRITDFGCPQTGALFGDLATATLISRMDSPKYPVHFQLLHAFAARQPAAGVYFDFALRENVLLPSLNGGKTRTAQRLVFSLDGMGIADAAPRAMSHAVNQALHAKGLRPEDVRFVIPHQAGTSIVRLATMKLEQLGIRGEVVNGLTSQVGNVSSSSIPYVFKKMWNRLEGTIACPTAAVATPGKAEISHGCILLETTPIHRRAAIAS
ncbi:MAG: 3-oxoacyl-[acyl-carrier-protein] synthase III C-terminal domain-containing protein [Pirellulaceae bacterium]